MVKRRDSYSPEGKVSIRKRHLVDKVLWRQIFAPWRIVVMIPPGVVRKEGIG